jgi:hypothetical protein
MMDILGAESAARPTSSCTVCDQYCSSAPGMHSVHVQVKQSLLLSCRKAMLVAGRGSGRTAAAPPKMAGRRSVPLVCRHSSTNCPRS